MRVCLLLSTVILIQSCRVAMLNDRQQEKITKEVREALHETFTDIKNHGFVAELKHLDNSPGFFWIPPRQANPISYDSVATILRRFSPGYRKVENLWDSIRVLPLNKKLASYTGRFQSTYTDTAGKVSVFNMMEIGVAVKRKNTWLLISGQTSVVSTK